MQHMSEVRTGKVMNLFNGWATLAARKPRRILANRSAGQLRCLEDLVVQMSNPAVLLGSVFACLLFWGPRLKHSLEVEGQSTSYPSEGKQRKILKMQP